MKCNQLTIALLGMLLCLVTGLQAADSNFMAGGAKHDITPLAPVPMWGYGARHAALSEGILDPLQATAVVIQAGDQKLAIVGLNLGRSPSEASLQKIRQRIRTEVGIEHSFIAGSHTHHRPVLESSDQEGKGKSSFDAAIRYYQQLEDAIVETIVAADRQLASATFATGTAELDGFNRSRHTELQPAPLDQALSVMRFDNASSRKPVAVLVSFTGRP